MCPSWQAPDLQYGNRPTSDVLAKILRVDIPPFLCKTQLYFSHSSLSLNKSYKWPHTTISITAQMVKWLPVMQVTRVQSHQVAFLTRRHLMSGIPVTHCYVQNAEQQIQPTDSQLLLSSPNLNSGIMHITLGIYFWHQKVNIQVYRDLNPTKFSLFPFPLSV
jgi:hypothetical protein